MSEFEDVIFELVKFDRLGYPKYNVGSFIRINLFGFTLSYRYAIIGVITYNRNKEFGVTFRDSVFNLSFYEINEINNKIKELNKAYKVRTWD